MIADGGGPRDVSGMFNGVTPEEVANALHPHNLRSDAVDFSINVLLIDTGQHRVLVDTGLGSAAGGKLLESVRASGMEPDAVTIVIITHGHGDHIGGLMDDAGERVFPNAQVLIPKADWDYYTSEANLVTMDEFNRNNVHKNLLPLRDRVQLYEGEIEIVPGVCVIPAPGHTYGHTAVEVVSGGTRLLHLADAAHHPIQLEHPDWSPQFDMQPDVSAQTRRKLFGRAAANSALLMAYHFPFPGLVRAHVKGEMWGWTNL